jgi:hypothetical protein
LASARGCGSPWSWCGARGGSAGTGLLRRALPPLAVTGIVVVVLLAPTAGRIVTYAKSLGTSPAAAGEIPQSNLGNLAHGISPYEALGIWENGDFRNLPADLFHQGELSALALAALAMGFLWCLGRRKFLMPAAVIACAVIFWRSDRTESPYLTAKALVIAGPLIGVTSVRGLIGRVNLEAPIASRW